MKHQIKNKKLNLSFHHRKAFLRNQAIHFINYGALKTTLVAAKEVRSFVEKIVTLAKKGNDFNARRRVKQLLPYNNEALKKLFLEIAPRYVSRPGGYTSVFKLGTRISDTAKIAKLVWVE